MKQFVAIVFFVLCCAVFSTNAQSADTVKFDDGSEIEVFSSFRKGKADKIDSIVHKSFTAEFYTILKAGYTFDDKNLLLLKKKESSLARKIKKITTAYEIRQDGKELIFAVFNSVNYEKFRSCNGKSAPCKIKCDAVVITLTDNGEKKNILVIKAIQRMK